MHPQHDPSRHLQPKKYVCQDQDSADEQSQQGHHQGSFHKCCNIGCGDDISVKVNLSKTQLGRSSLAQDCMQVAPMQHNVQCFVKNSKNSVCYPASAQNTKNTQQQSLQQQVCHVAMQCSSSGISYYGLFSLHACSSGMSCKCSP